MSTPESLQNTAKMTEVEGLLLDNILLKEQANNLQKALNKLEEEKDGTELSILRMRLQNLIISSRGIDTSKVQISLDPAAKTIKLLPK